MELTGYSGRTAATVRVITYDRARRVRRALAGLGTWWGAAVLSVLIPLAHFVLVPSFFLYGAFTFARRLTADQVAVAGRGTCPDCGREQALDVAGRWSVPSNTSCRYCQRSLRVTALPGTSEVPQHDLRTEITEGK